MFFEILSYIVAIVVVLLSYMLSYAIVLKNQRTTGLGKNRKKVGLLTRAGGSNKIVKKIKQIAAVFLIILFPVFAFWYGEAGKGLLQIAPYAVGAIGCYAIAACCSKKWVVKIFAGGAFISVYVFSFYLGGVSFNNAYNNCADEAEAVRSRLHEYYTQHGAYPQSLNQLKMQIPCQRYTRGSILDYTITESGYNLSFRDWLVEHIATESETFMAHK